MFGKVYKAKGYMSWLPKIWLGWLFRWRHEHTRNFKEKEQRTNSASAQHVNTLRFSWWATWSSRDPFMSAAPPYFSIPSVAMLPWENEYKETLETIEISKHNHRQVHTIQKKTQHKSSWRRARWHLQGIQRRLSTRVLPVFQCQILTWSWFQELLWVCR